jgi:oligopeptide/dipeptide ABC transporter ATP-binding protein
MGVIARMADRVVVMYAGEVVESAPLRDLFTAPLHPYTRLLLAAVPTARAKTDRLPVIPGTMPQPGAMPGGCRFHTRCPAVLPACRERAPELEAISPTRMSRCLRTREFLAEGTIPGPRGAAA